MSEVEGVRSIGGSKHAVEELERRARLLIKTQRKPRGSIVEVYSDYFIGDYGMIVTSQGILQIWSKGKWVFKRRFHQDAPIKHHDLAAQCLDLLRRVMVLDDLANV